MTTIVKAANAAQFLSLVPRLLGCHASRSLVLVPFDGSRTLGALRIDLPDEGGDPDEIAGTLLGMVCRIPATDGVALVVYCDDEVAAGMPHRALADAVTRRAEAFGLRLVDALCVAADGWGSYIDADAVARPLHELGDAMPEGFAELPDPDAGPLSGVALPAVSPAHATDCERAMAAFAHAVEVLGGPEAPAEIGAFGERRSSGPRVDPRALAAATLLDDVPVLYEDALSWDLEDLDPHDAAAMVWCLSRPALRDIALVGWSGHARDADEALQAQLGWERGEDYPAHLAMRMWGEGDRPDPERLRVALALVRALAARTPPDARAGVLSMCGWLAWALGRSSHAAHYARMARDIEPEHGLAEIVLSFVGAGHLPDWAFERRRT